MPEVADKKRKRLREASSFFIYPQDNVLLIAVRYQYNSTNKFEKRYNISFLTSDANNIQSDLLKR